MILGFQIQDLKGNNWLDRSVNDILTEFSAINELKAARIASPDSGFHIVAIPQGEIKQSNFECVLSISPEQYKALALSTSHLQEEDSEALEKLSHDADCNMIMARDSGWFVKLYDDAELNRYEGLSDTFHSILTQALASGYRMVEFDSAAQANEAFPTFEW